MECPLTSINNNTNLWCIKGVSKNLVETTKQQNNKNKKTKNKKTINEN
jgi:hypothetical protein